MLGAVHCCVISLLLFFFIAMLFFNSKILPVRPSKTFLGESWFKFLEPLQFYYYFVRLYVGNSSATYGRARPCL